jgi:hypothetical protein
MIYAETIKLLENFLIMAQKERISKYKIIDFEPEWVHYERNVMFELVNNLREDIKKDPITLEQLKQAEIYAERHYNYTRVFSTCCAKLVFDISVYS